MSAPPPTTSRDHLPPDVQEATTALLEAWQQVDALAQRFGPLMEQRFEIPRHRLLALGAVTRGATRIQDIAAASMTSESAASRTVDGLVQDGWLHREPDPQDRRATHVTLTGEGRRRMDEVRGWAKGLVGELITAFGVARAWRICDDLQAFAATLHEAFDALDGE